MTARNIVIIRHGEAMHNLPDGNDSIPDPYLTPNGIQQCRDILTSKRAAIVFDDINKHNLWIFASPLKRTILSAYFTFQQQLSLDNEAANTVVRYEPLLQEVDYVPAHTGSDRDDLVREFSHLTNQDQGDVDQTYRGHPSQLRKDWHDKTTVGSDGISYGNSPDALRKRAAAFRRYLRDCLNDDDVKVEPTVFIFTHGLFIPYLVNKEGEEMWENAEYHTYNFLNPNGNGTDDPEAQLQDLTMGPEEIEVLAFKEEEGTRKNPAKTAKRIALEGQGNTEDDAISISSSPVPSAFSADAPIFN